MVTMWLLIPSLQGQVFQLACNLSLPEPAENLNQFNPVLEAGGWVIRWNFNWVQTLQKEIH